MSHAVPDSNAYRLLAALGARGIHSLLANAGTDFAPLIEAEALGRSRGVAMPRFVNVPHEHTAVSIAHGAHLASGLPQVVGVHHTVGTANTVSAVMTAARERIPLLLLAGRTPSTEQGNIGSRDVIVHWGTDTFDQAGMIREYTKWDHELREGQCIESILDRALSIAMSEPRGPVYLTLPREVLAGAAKPTLSRSRPGPGASGAAPDSAAIRQLADWLLAAEHPVIVTSLAGRDPGAPEALAMLAQTAAIPVVEHYPRVVNLPATHPFHAGFDPAELVAEADLVISLDCEVPWIPRTTNPPENARIVHLGIDPLFPRIPVRSFPVDAAIIGEAGAALRALHRALKPHCESDTPAMARRRLAASQRQERRRQEAMSMLQPPADPDVIDPAWLSACLGEVIDDDCIVLNEYGLDLRQTALDKPGSFFSAGISGALGWTLPAALGIQMAQPRKTAIAVVGDGSYIFGNPVSCHYLAQAEQLPVLAIVLNNGGYTAVRRAVEVVYPDSVALQESVMPLAQFAPQPSYEGVAAACGAYAERVESRHELRARLRTALDIVRTEGRQVLLNVICKP
ncbi:MAG: thiamine pyrophosphate-requiring protein [Pigmentiphaga sp.]|nr:thiamine pyrophosphate-requiring protein [Pigmentiphaga sp.]